MIKVIHSCPLWLPLTQTWMYNQLKYLPSDQIECFVVCERTDHLDQFAIKNIYSLANASPIRYFWDKGLRKLRVRNHLGFTVKVAKKVGATILHSHFGDMGWVDLKVAENAKLKHVVTFYGVDVNMLPLQDMRWRERYRALFQKASLFLCEGPYMAQCLIRLSCPESKVRVHHLGVETKEIRYCPRYWAPNEPFKVLIAATFREKKGIPDAIESLAPINKIVPLQITIIGDSTAEKRSHIEKDRIMYMLDQYNLRPITRLLGFQPQSVLWKEAYQHHLFLSPSLSAHDGDTEGGAPVTLMEMAASGMPIVSTTHCDIPNVIRHGETGWLAPERDVAQLTQYIKWWIENPEQWINMLGSGRKYIETEFDVISQSKKLASYYGQLG